MALMGSAGVVVQLTDRNISHTSIAPASSYARYQLDSDGKVYRYTGTSPATPTTFVEDWVLPNNRASDYECFATLLSGSLATGTVGSWLALTSDRMWGVEDTSFTLQDAQLAISIRRVGTSDVLASASITLQAAQA